MQEKSSQQNSTETLYNTILKLMTLPQSEYDRSFDMLHKKLIASGDGILMVYWAMEHLEMSPMEAINDYFNLSPEDLSKQKGLITIDNDDLEQALAQKYPGKFNFANKNSQTQIAQMPLAKALMQHQSINDQVVTSIPMEVRGRTGTVPGTVKNWVFDYHDNLSAGKHSAMERGSYLFNSKNTKRLEARDRHALALILKSLDEETNIAIDTQNHKIVLDADVDKVSADAAQKSDVVIESNNNTQTPLVPTVANASKAQNIQYPQPRSTSIEQKLTAQKNKMTTTAQTPQTSPKMMQVDQLYTVKQKRTQSMEGGVHQSHNQNQPQNARDAFRTLHHDDFSKEGVAKKVMQQPTSQPTAQPVAQPQPKLQKQNTDIAFTSKQKLPVENMAKNVRQKMQNEQPQSQRQTPQQPQQSHKEKHGVPQQAPKPQKRRRYNMRPIE